MQYIKDGFTLPAPFNLIPVPESIFKLMKKCFRKIKEKKTLELEINEAEENAKENKIDDVIIVNNDQTTKHEINLKVIFICL